MAGRGVDEILHAEAEEPTPGFLGADDARSGQHGEVRPDALNGVAYTDDRLVVVKSSSKRYVRGGEPRVEIAVTSMKDQKSLKEFSP